MTNKIPTCLCKIVAEQDEEGLREGKKPSLSPQSPCYGCSGQRLICDSYSHPDIDEEAKRRLQHEQVYGRGRFILESSDD